MTNWITQLETQLSNAFGKQKGLALFQKYATAFPPGYADDNPIDIALADLAVIEELSDNNPIKLRFTYSAKREQPLHLRLLQFNRLIPLSTSLPILENLDLCTYKEHPYRINFDKDNKYVWISDYSVAYQQNKFAIDETHDLFQDAFISIYQGHCENDGLNKLILSAHLTWREITIFRTYAKYLKQINFRFSQTYIEKALYNHINITKDLINLFKTIHDPSININKTNPAAEKIEKRILAALENVSNLDEDNIIRRILILIKATLRTNYFQLNNNKQKSYLSFKLNSRTIADMPTPVPLYEIFVYSPRFEAIHLRNTKVARGGIRWSDRQEDFRTEILGLMKAQKVKNAVIVPSGAKGGFVLKTKSLPATREALQAEVIDCYKLFISGLLDLTDNIVGTQFRRPPQIVCLDDIDPYLVVAADKGTATFSDIANSISKAYGFWLGDAFASGGKTGYDHKKIGITARGTWESIKRHFQELNIDLAKQSISVVGIGDMSGDVFGNGMIYSNIKLVAAFDHRNIFIDPDPDPKISYKERLRLFQLANSSWEDYNPKLISAGGGVFKRSAKSITITAAMKKVLNIEESTLVPNDLIKAILKAPVDLLFNGGIGTYVKASGESNTDASDRTNDYTRINGEELQCKVVGEGGNLGFTQLGRIEFSLKGGLINTDFIDNSAGVDCSDHEVNLKILLNQQVHNKAISEIKRNEILAQVTDEIAALVLADNFEQALVMSFSAFRANKYIGLYSNYVKELETLGVLNRKVEFLPDDKKLLERKAAGISLTRPELAVLLAYTKIHVQQEILNSNLIDEPYLAQFVTTAFPPSIVKKFRKAMDSHRLRRDIVATQLSNRMVNEMGITFVYRLQMETNMSAAEIIRAYIIASEIFDTQKLQQLIVSLGFKITIEEQYDMLYNVRHLINLATRWFLQENRSKGDLEKIIQHYAKHVTLLEKIIPDLMGGSTKHYLQALTSQFLKIGLNKDVAERIATYRAIYTTLNIIEVATLHNFDLIKTAKVYFSAGEKVNLLWFRDQIANDSREGHWNTLARLTLRDELDIAQRMLAVAILKQDRHESSASKLINRWFADNKAGITRWHRLLETLHSASNIDYAMFFVAMRELIGFIISSQR